MLNARLNAARRITDALKPAENDLETAIASASQLIAAIAEGRRDSKVAINIGQDSLAALGDALEALFRARSSVVAAHKALARDRLDVGLGPYAMGDLGDCPSTAATFAMIEQDRSAA